MSQSFKHYGLRWPGRASPVEIEIRMIHGGGYLKNDSGVKCGEGLFFHYRQLQSLLWPDDDHHEWSDLILKTILEERITAVQGPKDSSKTRTISKYALTDYFCFPDDSLYLLSSTTLQGVQLRVWGDVKSLFARAKEVWPSCPGFPLDRLKW